MPFSGTPDLPWHKPQPGQQCCVQRAEEHSREKHQTFPWRREVYHPLLNVHEEREAAVPVKDEALSDAYPFSLCLFVCICTVRIIKFYAFLKVAVFQLSFACFHFQPMPSFSINQE